MLTEEVANVVLVLEVIDILEEANTGVELTKRFFVGLPVPFLTHLFCFSGSSLIISADVSTFAHQILVGSADVDLIGSSRGGHNTRLASGSLTTPSFTRIFACLTHTSHGLSEPHAEHGQGWGSFSKVLDVDSEGK